MPQKPDESQPERRGAGIAFVEQGMNRGKQGSQKIKACGQVRPIPGNLIEPIHRWPLYGRSPTDASWFGRTARRAQADTAAERRIMRQRTRTINLLPDKSGIPAETMRLDFCRIKVRTATRRHS